MAKPGRGEWELVPKAVWVKPSFVALDVDGRLLYLWSWQHPGSALSGLYEASPRKLLQSFAKPNGTAPAELLERLRAALVDVSRKPLMLYDDDYEVVWVCDRVDHTLRSPNAAVRIRREYETCPPSPLKRQFARRYGERLGIDPDERS